MPNSPAPVRAPRLPQNPERWINAGVDSKSTPNFTGKVTLLHFWTFGCANCWHVLHDLKELQAIFADEAFQIVSVHSPKFDHEKNADALMQAALRLHITHPVINDADHELRKSYAVKAWPTLIVVDARGYIALHVSGEGNKNKLGDTIAGLLSQNTNGTTQNISYHSEPPIIGGQGGNSPLRFPGKVCADTVNNRLFISDTGSHRLVIAPLDDSGKTASDYTVVGDGLPNDFGWGYANRPFETARFVKPQGVAVSPNGNTLLVVDAGHSLSQVDLATRTVEIIAEGYHETRAVGNKNELIFRLPWDVAFVNDAWCAVALAGSHQIVLVENYVGIPELWAGEAQREGNMDGQAEKAHFAQPSGIAWDDENKTLYVADAETSCLRVIHWGEVTRKVSPSGVVTYKRHDFVTTLAGGGGLFEWGLVDGMGSAARFQHPQGVAYLDGFVYVADTYNHALRRVDAQTGQTTTLWRGAPLNEPGGLCVAEGKIIMANTNAHSVCAYDVATGKMTPFALRGLCDPDLCFPDEEEL